MKKLIIASLSLAVLSGCAFAQRGADQLAKGVRIYCDEPYQARLVVRDTVNRSLAADGHSVTVTCAGDPQP